LKEIIEKLMQSQTILLLTHLSPDPDALGSTFALRTALLKLGKTAKVLLYAPITPSLQYLTDDYDIFDEAKEYPCDLLVCLDSGSADRLDKAICLLDKQPHSINIDHHRDNTHYAEINHVEGERGSAGEIVYDLLSQMNLIDQKIAFYLYAAICSDTGGFRYSSTTPQTLRIAADLMEYSIDFRFINRELFETKELPLLKLQARVIDDIKLYADGKIAAVTVSKQMQDEFHLDDEEINGMVNIARNIKGVWLGISFKEAKDKIKISLRSEGQVDVSKIAGQFGGGGHIRAAGIGLPSTLEDTQKMVLSACIKAVECGVKAE